MCVPHTHPENLSPPTGCVYAHQNYLRFRLPLAFGPSLVAAFDLLIAADPLSRRPAAALFMAA